MEIEYKKKKNYLEIIVLLLFIVFLILYISQEAGYYEYKVHQKSVLTEEAIIQFEKDLQEGKEVKASDYIKNNYIDYSNKITIASSKLSNYIEEVMNNGVKKTIRILGKLFWE